jgi:hypothetical protein
LSNLFLFWWFRSRAATWTVCSGAFHLASRTPPAAAQPPLLALGSSQSAPGLAGLQPGYHSTRDRSGGCLAVLPRKYPDEPNAPTRNTCAHKPLAHPSGFSMNNVRVKFRLPASHPCSHPARKLHNRQSFHCHWVERCGYIIKGVGTLILRVYHGNCIVR